MLIGLRTLYSDHVLLRIRSFQLELMEKHKVMVLAYQVGLFHLTLTQLNSEMNCIAENECPESQKLDMRRRGENLNTTSDTSESNNMYIFAFFVFDLFNVRQEKRQKVLLSFWNRVFFCRMFVLLLERDRPVIRSHQDLIRFNNNIPWLARTIYNYVNVYFVFVFFLWYK